MKNKVIGPGGLAATGRSADGTTSSGRQLTPSQLKTLDFDSKKWSKMGQMPEGSSDDVAKLTASASPSGNRPGVDNTGIVEPVTDEEAAMQAALAAFGVDDDELSRQLQGYADSLSTFFDVLPSLLLTIAEVGVIFCITLLRELLVWACNVFLVMEGMKW